MLRVLENSLLLRLASDIAQRIAGPAGSKLLDAAGRAIRGVAIGVIGAALLEGVLAWLGFAIAGVPLEWSLRKTDDVAARRNISVTSKTDNGDAQGGGVQVHAPILLPKGARRMSHRAMSARTRGSVRRCFSRRQLAS